MPCDEIQLRLGRIVDPIIEDAPSSELGKESGEKQPADTTSHHEEIQEIAETPVDSTEPPFPE